MNPSHSYKKNLKVDEISDNSESLINAVPISEELKVKLLKTPIIVYPQSGFRNFNEPLFPQGTEEIYRYLQTNLPPNTPIDICIEDNDYFELALHADLKRIGIFIVASVVLPIFLGVVSSYINNKILSTSKDDDISISIIITETECSTSKKIFYEGPAKDFTRISKDIEKIMETNGD